MKLNHIFLIIGIAAAAYFAITIQRANDRIEDLLWENDSLKSVVPDTLLVLVKGDVEWDSLYIPGRPDTIRQDSLIFISKHDTLRLFASGTIYIDTTFFHELSGAKFHLQMEIPFPEGEAKLIYSFMVPRQKPKAKWRVGTALGLVKDYEPFAFPYVQRGRFGLGFFVKKDLFGVGLMFNF